MVRGKKNPRHLLFSRRLKKAHKASRLSYASLAEAAGLSGAGTVQYLASGDRTPRIDTVERLARALDVSPCWLAYGYDGPLSEQTDLLCAALSSRLAEARAYLGMSRKELGRYSKTSDTAVRKAEVGEACPNIATVESLADALCVTPCWLAYGIGKRTPAPRRRNAIS